MLKSSENNFITTQRKQSSLMSKRGSLPPLRDSIDMNSKLQISILSDEQSMLNVNHSTDRSARHLTLPKVSHFRSAQQSPSVDSQGRSSVNRITFINKTK
jgi:hypothetical protein